MSEEKAGAFLYALSVLELVSASAPARGREEAAPAAAESPVAEDTSLASPERIEELSAKLGSLNLYQMLRLEPGAGLDDIKGSYLSLAKEFHPDRYFDDRYDPYREKITSIFMRINEAHNVLSDADKREDYDRREIRLEPSRLETGGLEDRERAVPQRHGNPQVRRSLDRHRVFSLGSAAQPEKPPLSFLARCGPDEHQKEAPRGRGTL
jgi:curved DNA-binding protein CbpA